MDTDNIHRQEEGKNKEKISKEAHLPQETALKNMVGRSMELTRWGDMNITKRNSISMAAE